MPDSIARETGAPKLLLTHHCSQWIASSQHAADLYDSGVMLWRKEDLVDIEQQLAQSCILEQFTLRRIDGSIVHMRNPMVGVRKPIWRPYVKFQDYWFLVRNMPDGSPDTYHCTYLVDWINQSVYNYEGRPEAMQSLFNSTKKDWESSETCAALTSLLRGLLGGNRSATRVTKIICFGLGDLNHKPPYWWTIQNKSLPEQEREPETAVVEKALLHHAIALTLADIARSYVPNDGRGVRLLTQDPRYFDETCDMLRGYGFEVIGRFGAAGFAELDDDSIVFSPFTNAPVKQMIAEFARPAAILTAETPDSDIFNHKGIPWPDAESPRTKQMWQGYKVRKFPVASESVQLGGGLSRLVVYTKVAQ